jgi:hypothetical protein
VNKEEILRLYEYRDGELYWRVARSNRVKVGQLAGDVDGRGYRRVYSNGRHWKVHRLIWIMHNRFLDDNEIIDRIDRDRTNNRIENLRLSNKSANAINSDFTERAKGYHYDSNRGKWRAQISINNKSVTLGRFDTKEEAQAAYAEACKTRKQ